MSARLGLTAAPRVLPAPFQLSLSPAALISLQHAPHWGASTVLVQRIQASTLPQTRMWQHVSGMSSPLVWFTVWSTCLNTLPAPRRTARSTNRFNLMRARVLLLPEVPSHRTTRVSGRPLICLSLRLARSDHRVVITRLQTFCDAYQPVTDAESLVFSTVGTRTGPGFGLPSITPSANNALPNSGESSESAETASSSTGAGARGLAVPGFMTWLIEVATLLLSFFIML